jgi:hypothetical protein
VETVARRGGNWSEEGWKLETRRGGNWSEEGWKLVSKLQFLIKKDKKNLSK